MRLLGEGAVVEVVAEDPEREDGDGEGVAAPARVVEREARQNLVAVFCDRVGRNASTRVNLGASAPEQIADSPCRATMFQKSGFYWSSSKSGPAAPCIEKQVPQRQEPSKRRRSKHTKRIEPTAIQRLGWLRSMYCRGPVILHECLSEA